MNELNDLEQFRNGSGAVASIRVNGKEISRAKPTFTMKETVYDPTEEIDSKKENNPRPIEKNEEMDNEIVQQPLKQVILNDEVKSKINLNKINQEKEIKELAKSILPFINVEDSEKAAAKAIEKAIVFENTWRKVWENKKE